MKPSSEGKAIWVYTSMLNNMTSLPMECGRVGWWRIKTLTHPHNLLPVKSSCHTSCSTAPSFYFYFLLIGLETAKKMTEHPWSAFGSDVLAAGPSFTTFSLMPNIFLYLSSEWVKTDGLNLLGKALPPCAFQETVGTSYPFSSCLLWVKPKETTKCSSWDTAGVT